MKKRLVLGLCVGMILTLSSCGKGDTVNTTASSELSESQVESSVESSVATETEGGENKQETNEGEGLQNNDPSVGDEKESGGSRAPEESKVPNESKGNLEDVALHLTYTNLYYCGVSYVENVNQDGWAPWVPDLDDFFDTFEEGALSWYFSDLDSDGVQELVVWEAALPEKQKVAYQVSVYEEKDGIATLSDSKCFFDDVVNHYEDISTTRFWIKDGKYLLADRESYGLFSDGFTYGLSAFSYDGTKLKNEMQFETSGSDLQGIGELLQDQVEELKHLGMTKSATALKERDVISFCAAEDGLESILKINFENSYNYEGGERPYSYTIFREGLAEKDAYILPEISTRKLTEKELEGFTKKELQYARNELYARYGWSFNNEELASYFATKSWYKRTENIQDDQLTAIEKKNRDLIVKMEKNAPEYKDLEKMYGTRLSEAELTQLQGLLNTEGYNGMLRNLYRDIRDVDLGEVLYNGIGLDADFSVEEYMQVTGEEEIYTDITAISENDLKVYVEKQFGYPLTEMRQGLGWIYLPESKVYAFEHGDTNFSPVTVLEGYQDTNGNVALVYTDDWSWDSDAEYVVTLRKVGDEYRVISNELYR